MNSEAVCSEKFKGLDRSKKLIHSKKSQSPKSGNIEFLSQYLGNDRVQDNSEIITRRNSRNYTVDLRRSIDMRSKRNSYQASIKNEASKNALNLRCSDRSSETHNSNDIRKTIIEAQVNDFKLMSKKETDKCR